MAPCFGQRRQDSWYSWVVCVCATLANVVTMGMSFSFGVLYPALLDYFKEGKSKTGTRQTMVGPLQHKCIVAAFTRVRSTHWLFLREKINRPFLVRGQMRQL